MNLCEKDKILKNLNFIELDFGISIDILYNALKYGVIDVNEQKHKYLTLDYDHIFNKGWYLYTPHKTYGFLLNDYKKTWFLLSEKKVIDVIIELDNTDYLIS